MSEEAFCFSYEEVASKLLLVNKADRLDVFLDEFADEVSDPDYWRAVSLLWTSMEWPSKQEGWFAAWTDIFREPSRASVMTVEERAELAALPTQVTIYRGFSREEWRGWSWTLDRSRGEMFARRFATLFGPGSLAVATVPREAILALLNGRDEHEIVLLPDNTKVEIVEIEPCRDDAES